ncbi:MAG: Toxin SymE, type I toxin-antitoxin system [Bacteriophage sp.]|nr:MAG: Toxin SymE, type I toxin-antitoxin system [Bacteriophage sp.]
MYINLTYIREVRLIKVERNIMINKAGGNSGKETVNYRISLPAEAVRMLGVTKEDRKVILEYDEEKIIIKKA